MDWAQIVSFGGPIVAVLVALGGAYKWFYEVRKQRLEKDRHILETLYGPLMSALLDVHLTSYTSTLYPTFTFRLKHALEEFAERKYLKAKFKCFFQALFDKGTSDPSGEVEFGGSFPIDKIGQILKKHTHLAPPKLLRLYSAATRSLYEEPGQEITAAHLSLIEHIHREHERLRKKIY